MRQLLPITCRYLGQLVEDPAEAEASVRKGVAILRAYMQQFYVSHCTPTRVSVLAGFGAASMQAARLLLSWPVLWLQGHCHGCILALPLAVLACIAACTHSHVHAHHIAPGSFFCARRPRPHEGAGHVGCAADGPRRAADGS